MYEQREEINMMAPETLFKLEELIELRQQVCFEMIEAEGESLEDLELKLEEVENEISELSYQYGIDEYEIEELEQQREA